MPSDSRGSLQVLLFLALFGVGLYFMCHISVGLDQELALPKVSCAGGLGPRGGDPDTAGGAACVVGCRTLPEWARRDLV